jgi:hypothetical protein
MGAAAVPILVASAVVSAGSAIQSGRQQKAFANYQADQAEADAAAEKGAALVRAERIRSIARKTRGSARADLAAAGVSVGEGTPLLIEEDIIKRGEEDALIGIDDAQDAASRLRAQASGLRMQGNQAQTAGYINAASSALAAGNTYNGWKGAFNAGSGSGAGTGSAVVDARGARAT